MAAESRAAEMDEQVVPDSLWIIIIRCLYTDPIERRAEHLLTSNLQPDVELSHVNILCISPLRTCCLVYYSFDCSVPCCNIYIYSCEHPFFRLWSPWWHLVSFSSLPMLISLQFGYSIIFSKMMYGDNNGTFLMPLDRKPVLLNEAKYIFDISMWWLNTVIIQSCFTHSHKE